MPTWPLAPAPVIFGQALERGLGFGDGEIERDLEPLEEARDESAFLRDQGVEKMLDVDGLIAEADGFLLRGAEGGAGLFGKFI